MAEFVTFGSPGPRRVSKSHPAHSKGRLDLDWVGGGNQQKAGIAAPLPPPLERAEWLLHRMGPWWRILEGSHEFISSDRTQDLQKEAL